MVSFFNRFIRWLTISASVIDGLGKSKLPSYHWNQYANGRRNDAGEDGMSVTEFRDMALECGHRGLTSLWHEQQREKQSVAHDDGI